MNMFTGTALRMPANAKYHRQGTQFTLVQALGKVGQEQANKAAQQ